MIYGIGIDIIKIDRLKTVAEKWGEKFLKKVFTKNEIAYCYAKKEPYLSLSVRFAAKEAMIKAIGSGVPVAFKDIEIMNYDSGRPFIKVSGMLEAFFEKKSIRCAHLSLSHEKEYGVACVILEGSL
ncbi:MAG: holo-ACP synthase [Nitrospirota bacterium]|nr:holo-ACP synthase [Nitrospirota bacterium]